MHFWVRGDRAEGGIARFQNAVESVLQRHKLSRRVRWFLPRDLNQTAPSWFKFELELETKAGSGTRPEERTTKPPPRANVKIKASTSPQPGAPLILTAVPKTRLGAYGAGNLSEGKVGPLW